MYWDERCCIIAEPKGGVPIMIHAKSARRKNSSYCCAIQSNRGILHGQGNCWHCHYTGTMDGYRRPFTDRINCQCHSKTHYPELVIPDGSRSDTQWRTDRRSDVISYCFVSSFHLQLILINIWKYSGCLHIRQVSFRPHTICKMTCCLQMPDLCGFGHINCIFMFEFLFEIVIDTHELLMLCLKGHWF